MVGFDKKTRFKAMEFRLRDRRLYTTLRFEAFFEEFPEMDT